MRGPKTPNPLRSFDGSFGHHRDRAYAQKKCKCVAPGSPSLSNTVSLESLGHRGRGHTQEHYTNEHKLNTVFFPANFSENNLFTHLSTTIFNNV